MKCRKKRERAHRNVAQDKEQSAKSTKAYIYKNAIVVFCRLKINFIKNEHHKNYGERNSHTIHIRNDESYWSPAFLLWVARSALRNIWMRKMVFHFVLANNKQFFTRHERFQNTAIQLLAGGIIRMSRIWFPLLRLYINRFPTLNYWIEFRWLVVCVCAVWWKALQYLMISFCISSTSTLNQTRPNQTEQCRNKILLFSI